MNTYLIYYFERHEQDHAHEYPTLAKLALDILAVPASLVPCEWLFSAG